MSFQKLKEIAGTHGEAGNPAGGSSQAVRVLGKGPPEPAPGACPPSRPAPGASPLRGGAGAGPGGRPLSQAAPRARRQFGHVPGHVAPALAIFAASCLWPLPPPLPEPRSLGPPRRPPPPWTSSGWPGTCPTWRPSSSCCWRSGRRAPAPVSGGRGPGETRAWGRVSGRTRRPRLPHGPRACAGPTHPLGRPRGRRGPGGACGPSGLKLRPGRGVAALGPALHLVGSRTWAVGEGEAPTGQRGALFCLKSLDGGAGVRQARPPPAALVGASPNACAGGPEVRGARESMGRAEGGWAGRRRFGLTWQTTQPGRWGWCGERSPCSPPCPFEDWPLG